MATKRHKLASRQIGIPAAAIEAWLAGDFYGLNQALGIRPWQAAPWPVRMTALGCDPKRPPEGGGPWGQSWQRAVELQTALLEAAGEPPASLMEG